MEDGCERGGWEREVMVLKPLMEGIWDRGSLSYSGIVWRELAERKHSSAQMLDIRTRSFTLPQAEMLGTILMVAINARLPIYKDGKVTEHF